MHFFHFGMVRRLAWLCPIWEKPWVSSITATVRFRETKYPTCFSWVKISSSPLLAKLPSCQYHPQLSPQPPLCRLVPILAELPWSSRLGCLVEIVWLECSRLIQLDGDIQVVNLEGCRGASNVQSCSICRMRHVTRVLGRQPWQQVAGILDGQVE